MICNGKHRGPDGRFGNSGTLCEYEILDLPEKMYFFFSKLVVQAPNRNNLIIVTCVSSLG